ncbi:MAG TPA: DNA alkylation repair protein [Firmicutes bacterium]|nr:DNA alkylation repair protein [Bacillota bacterium]
MAFSLASILSLLQQGADPERAQQMAAYMRDRFPFFGINKPERKALTSQLLKGSRKIPVRQLLDLVQELYGQPQRECHYLAIDLLERNYRRLSYEEFQFMYSLIDQNAWWDSVDALRKPMSLWVKEHKAYLDEVMGVLLASASFWQRRVAITMQLLWKETTDTQWLERAILENRDDQEFFIQKAIGWALRDYSKTNPDWVRALLQEHELSKLAVREGSKYV